LESGCYRDNEFNATDTAISERLRYGLDNVQRRAYLPIRVILRDVKRVGTDGPIVVGNRLCWAPNNVEQTFRPRGDLIPPGSLGPVQRGTLFGSEGPLAGTRPLGSRLERSSSASPP
jgi:hypothetical protein